LVRRLGISPQAIHRHLKLLVASGCLEIRGRGPKTRYFIAGTPEFGRLRQWYASSAEPAENPSDLVCETRDVFAARLSRLSSLSKEGLKEDELPLAISIVGEVGNNCFDHNLGHWRDVPGCWFETQVTGARLWICIADRGRGVFRSLSSADPTIPDEQTALWTAFEKKVSGREPEHRGNGLKFVRNIVVQGAARGLACRSGSAVVEYGPLGRDCLTHVSAFSSETSGTVTLLVWSLK